MNLHVQWASEHVSEVGVVGAIVDGFKLQNFAPNGKSSQFYYGNC